MPRGASSGRAWPSSRSRSAPPGPGTCRRCRRERPGSARARSRRPGRCTAATIRMSSRPIGRASPSHVGPPGVARRRAVADELGDRVGLLGRLVLVARVRRPATQRMPGPGRARPTPSSACRSRPACGREAALVEHLRRERADVGVQPPGAVEEEAEVGRHRPAPPRRWPSADSLGARRVGALERLVQLLRVAEQHQARRGRRDGEGVGERHLPGLVDEQHVERCRRSPRATRARPCRPTTSTSPAARASTQRRVVVEGLGRWRRSARHRCRASGRSAPSTPRSLGRLGDRVEQVADHLVAVGGHADAPARRRRAPGSSARRCTSCRSPGGPGWRA